MGTHRPRRRPQVGARALNHDRPVATVRVRPDVAAVDRTFDYAVPAKWHDDGTAASLRIGDRVRVALHGRRIAGWIVAFDPDPLPGLKLAPLLRWSGHGPDAATIELCEWAGRRWLGAPAKLLRTASAPKNVYRLPAPSLIRYEGEVDQWAHACFEGPGSVVRLGPGEDRWPLVLAACALGNPLLLVPTVELAGQLAGRLRRAGLTTALLPDDWAQAAAGGVVVGTRAAALGPTSQLGAVVVFDEHDDAYREERTPTWHARDVAVERAERAGVPCVLVSPIPSPAAAVLSELPLRSKSRVDEYAAWPDVQVIDRREEPPGRLGLFSEGLARELQGTHRVACILNRTGRVRLLACVACGELTRCDRCDGPTRQIDDSTLTCMRCLHERPPVCVECGGARLKNLVLGVSRAREELSALIGEPVGEYTAAAVDNGDARVVIGTEALLRTTPAAGRRWRAVAFLDFDQHLTAMRQRSDEDAAALLILAARQVGARAGGGKILLQTRLVDHRVVVAARRGETGPLTDELIDQAGAMRWPPAVAQAEVSGKGAAAFIDRLGQPLGVDILGPNEDRWLLRADNPSHLTDELRQIERGSERLRIAVD